MLTIVFRSQVLCDGIKENKQFNIIYRQLTPAPPDSQGRTGDRGRKTGKSKLAAGELIRYVHH